MRPRPGRRPAAHAERPPARSLTLGRVPTRDARINLLASASGRRWLFALLYLSEGAPIGFVWWALPTLLRGAGLELAAITTLTTLATLPWMLKFLVGPVIDARLQRGRSLKRWILVCQLSMSLTLLPLAFVDWAAQFPLLVAVVVLHAIFAAAQDVGIDTLAIRTVPEHELGRINGWMQTGMLGGRAAVAAGSTLAASAFGDPAFAVLSLAALIFLPVLLLLIAVEEPQLPHAHTSLRAAWKLITTRAGLAGLALALLGGAGFEFYGVSAGPRLADSGLSETRLAMLYGALAPAGLAAGALAGGVLSDRIGPLRGSAASLALLVVVLFSIAFGESSVDLLPAKIGGFGVAYLAIGAFTASSYALFMTLSRGEFAATRFTLFMAMTNACEAWSGFVGGRLAAYGYGYALALLTGVACIAAVPVYILWRNSNEYGRE